MTPVVTSQLRATRRGSFSRRVDSRGGGIMSLEGAPSVAVYTPGEAASRYPEGLDPRGGGSLRERINTQGDLSLGAPLTREQQLL